MRGVSQTFQEKRLRGQGREKREGEEREEDIHPSTS
jgi:hypothetical protein